MGARPPFEPTYRSLIHCLSFLFDSMGIPF